MATLSTGYGQITGAQSSINDVVDPAQTNSDLRYGSRFNGVAGTPYLFDHWTAGHIVISAGGRIEKVMVKYDAYSDELNFQTPEGKGFVLNKEKVTSFGITDPGNNLVMTFKKFKVDGFKGKSYCQVIYEGKKVSMVNKINIYITEKNTASGSYNNSKADPQKFKRVNNYFLLKGDKQSVKVNKNKKSMLSALKDQEAKLRSFVKSEKIDFKSDSDLIKLVQYYEGL